MDFEQSVTKARLFRALHAGPNLLVLPNAWDAASARRFQAAGFPAIATSSGAVAQTLGYGDHEQAPVEEMLAAAARIVRAVSVPVTVDFEAGYGLSPSEIARRLIEIGAVGLNLEDTDHRAGVLVPPEAQAERLGAVKAAARRLGTDLFLNARVDVFVRSEGDSATRVGDALRRGRLYREAGADCVYPIALADHEVVRVLVAALEVVNVLLGPAGSLTLDAARAAGARRGTFGTRPFRDTMAALDAIAAEIHAAASAAKRTVRGTADGLLPGPG